VTGTASLFPDESPNPALPSGLFYAPNFLTVNDQRQLVEAIDANDWSLELKRRVQHYGYRYDYKARRIDPSMHLGPLPPFAVPIASELQTVTSFAQPPDQLIVNEYRPGQGISAHVDCETCFNNRVAIISLGWPYQMEFQHTHTRIITKLLLGVGSLLVLADDARYQWTHQIRARLQDHGVPRQRRLSLTFRKVLLSE
jgi:alkylated DNA repair dioxygenase AlkB